MSSYIQNILERSLGDGARATHFDVEIHFTDPLAPTARELSTVCKTTQFPSKSHEKIDFMYKGRSIPIKGQTKYSQTWTATFYLSEDHKLRHAFEDWIEAIDQKHNYDDGVGFGVSRTQAVHASSGYTKTVKLYQTSFEDDQNTAVYTLYNVFPTEISELEYSADNVAAVQEFTVTFAYSHYNLGTSRGINGNFVDETVAKVRGGLENAAKDVLNQVAGGINNAIGGFFRR